MFGSQGRQQCCVDFSKNIERTMQFNSFCACQEPSESPDRCCSIRFLVHLMCLSLEIMKSENKIKTLEMCFNHEGH